MSEKLKVLNIQWKERGIPEVAIGVGLNKGEVVVGNMGSEKRFNYTIMGDEVNYGSRLEGLTKKYGAECLISESVRDEIKNDQDFLIRELDTVMVKGKKEPKRIFELIADNVDTKKKEDILLFEKGLALYRKAEWENALEILGSIPNDISARVLMERIKELKANPPENWNGVYEHGSK